MELLWFIISILIQLSVKASADDKHVRFLEDYFFHKNVMITANLCWPKGDLLELQRTLQMANSNSQKQMCIYNVGADTSRFFNHLSTDNYFVMDLRSCRTSEVLLEMANSSNLFRYPLKYLLLVDDSVHQQLLSKMETFSIYPTSDVVVGSISQGNVDLMQYYRVGKGRELVAEHYGKWTPNAGFEEYYRKESSTGTRRRNLQQFQLTADIIVTSNATFDHLLDYSYPRDDSFTKQDYPIFDLLRQYVNATYRLKPFDSYGYMNQTTGELDGIVGDMKYHRADLAGQSMYFTSDRFTGVEFLNYINPLPIRFIVRKPSLSYVKNIFIIAFRWNLWLSCLIVLAMFSACTWSILSYEVDITKNKMNINRRFTVSDAALIALEALCQQGTAFETRSISGRVAFLMLFTSFMAIYVAYSAYIVVLLQSTTKIESLNDFLQSRIAAGGENTTYMRTYFEGEKSGVLRDIYRTKIYPDQFYDIVDGLKKVQAGNFAFHTRLGASYDYILENFSAHEICGLQELPGYMEFLRGYSAVPKNSPYKEIFKIGLLKIDEHGMRRRSVEKIFIKPKCYMQGASFQNVGIYDCYEIFAIWSCGVAIAGIVCIFENTFHRLRGSYSSRLSKKMILFQPVSNQY